jgi:hypothetical protein
LQFKASLGKQFTRPYLEKTHHQKGMLEWLKVYALSLNPSTGKKKKVECGSMCLLSQLHKKCKYEDQKV